VNYTTIWTSTVNHSRVTTVAGGHTTSWLTTKYLRLTANNAGGIKSTAALSANDYGHSYIASGVWVEG
jgi:hypothetical protein